MKRGQSVSSLGSEQAGFTLVDILLGGATFALIISVLVGAVIYGRESGALAGLRARAAFHADEGLEAVRNIRDERFSIVTPGFHGLAIVSNQWIFSGSEDIQSPFRRQIEVADINANIKRVTSTVAWQQNAARAATLALSTFLTNWRKGVGGMLTYADFSGNDDVIRYRILDAEGTWGPDQTIPDFGVPLDRDTRRIELYAAPTRNEKILITKHVENGAGDDHYLYAQVWSGSSWGNVMQLASWAGIDRPDLRDFDGDYLANGDFLLVYEDNSNTPKYRIWNGTAWSSQGATLNVGGKPDWIVVRNRPGTNEAMVAVRDAGEDTNTLYWNGSSWGSLTEHAKNSSGVNFENISFAWSPNNSPYGALTFNEAADNFPNIRIWNGASWSSNVENQNIGGVARVMQLTARPNAADFLGCFKDSANDINCLKSDFSPLWTVLLNGELGVNTDAGVQRSFDIEYESQTGKFALAVYTEGATATQQAIPKYRTFDAQVSTWSGEVSLGSVGATLETVKLVPDPLGNDIAVLLGTTNQGLWSIFWDGAAHSFFTMGGLVQLQQGGAGSFDEDFWFDFVWDRY